MPETTVPGGVSAPELRGHLAVPPVGEGPWPGVVVVHEAFGLNDDTRAQADRLAAADVEVFLAGSRQHARRRSAEMAAAAEQLRDLGVPPRVAEAARDQLAALADLSSAVDDGTSGSTAQEGDPA